MTTTTMPVKYEQQYFNEEFGLEVGANSSSSSSSTSSKSSSDEDLGVDFLLNEEVWKKFENEYSDLFRATYFDDFIHEISLDNPLDSLFAQVEQEELDGFFGSEKQDDVMLHSHDCMWAGHCGSSEHPVEESSSSSTSSSSTSNIRTESEIERCDLMKTISPLMIGTGGESFRTPVSNGKGGVQVATSQQSLLKSNLRTAAGGLPVINMITPQTPPMSDDEEKHHIKQPQVLKIFPTPQEDYDDADQDLCDYFGEKFEEELQQQENNEAAASTASESSDSSESSSSESEDDEEDEEERPQQQQQYGPSTSMAMANVYATENDHSYHKDKNASMRMANLGIDTPSDSEEEIDVVSVSDKKYTAASRMSCALPTNPSMRDRRHLQKTMETAMNTGRRNNNNNNGGLKIMLPTKRAAASPANCQPPKKRANLLSETANRGGNNKKRQYRTTNANATNNSNATYRRRNNYNHDSESEPEPSEKRSLHNNMERQRRIDLRNAFEYLRQLVPEVLKKERAAKVVILREAAKYCDNLTYNSMSLAKQSEDLKRHQERLRMRVSMLRRNLAQKR